MEYYNKYIKYKKKYYNLKYGGSKKFNINKFKNNFIKQLQNCSSYLDNCDNYGLGKNFSQFNIFILEISYDESKNQLEFKNSSDNIKANTNIYVPIYINKKFIEHYLLDNKEIKLDPPKQKIYRPSGIVESLSTKNYRDYQKYRNYIIEYYKYSDRNIMIPIKFKEIGISEIQKSYAHNKPGYKYVFLPKNIIEEYYKNNILFLKSKNKTDIINDIFYMTDGRQYIYKEFEAENKEDKEKKEVEKKKNIDKIKQFIQIKDYEKIFDLIFTIIYIDYVYKKKHKDYKNQQYLLNYNAPSNLKENFSKIFKERYSYYKMFFNRDYNFSKKTKKLLINLGFSDDIIKNLLNYINNYFYKKLINHKYKDNIEQLFEIKYNQCKNNVPLSDLEQKTGDESINIFKDMIENKDNTDKKTKFFKLLTENKFYYNNDNFIKIYFNLLGEKYNKTLNILKKSKEDDLKKFITNNKKSLQELFNHNIIFLGEHYFTSSKNKYLLIIRQMFYLLYSIFIIPLLYWDLLINKYIFACRLNNMKRFFIFLKKERKLKIKPENRAFNYNKDNHIFLNKIEYNNKYLWVFLDIKTQKLIFIDRTSSRVYLNNSSIPTNVLYTELKMLLWRKDFTNEDFKFFHIIDEDEKHDTVFCINTKTLDEEYIYENAKPKPILVESGDVKSKPISTKGGMNKSKSEHKIIINKYNFIINGITVREVELRMDTDGRTIGFFNLQSK